MTRRHRPDDTVDDWILARLADGPMTVPELIRAWPRDADAGPGIHDRVQRLVMDGRVERTDRRGEPVYRSPAPAA